MHDERCAQSALHSRMPVCGGRAIVPILDLGDTPLADRLLTAEQLDQPEFFAPLKVMFCRIAPLCRSAKP